MKLHTDNLQSTCDLQVTLNMTGHDLDLNSVSHHIEVNSFWTVFHKEMSTGLKFF